MGRIGEDLWKKNVRKCQNRIFLGKKPVGCTCTDWQWVTGTGTGQRDTSTTCSSSPVFGYFAPLSPVIIHRLFRDPKK